VVREGGQWGIFCRVYEALSKVQTNLGGIPLFDYCHLEQGGENRPTTVKVPIAF
jgi:hypothetical protein